MYRYEAADSGGKVLRGAMDAPSSQEVLRRLEDRGYHDVRVLTTGSAAPVPPPAASGWRPPARAEDLALFFRQMAALSTAGFTPSAALADLGPRTAHAGLSRAARQMAQTTGGGGSLAAAMAHEGGLFPEHVVGLVAAGEQGGFLPFAFEEAALGAEQDAALRKGMWWAKLLAWQAIWSVLLFAPIFPSIDFESAMRTLANYLRVLVRGVLPIGLGMHLLAWWLGRLWATPAAASWRDRLVLRLPVTARLARARALASFTRVLRRLLASGVSPETAYTAAARAVPNTALRDHLLSGVSVLRAAGGIDAAIEASGLMAHDPLQMLVTGQKTGTWNETLDQVATLYQEEAAQATDAARNFQKRLGVLLTIVTMGYVTIAGTLGGFQLTMRFADSFAGP